nr:reverse transcriptase domain-containing protein [Tanacetum cinerariifolium]
MADQRTMAKLLRAPTEGYAEEIVVPPILAEQFELKNILINMMTSDLFFGLEKDNPPDHIRWGSPSMARKRTPEFYSHLRGSYLLRACPHHGFTELHQLDTFYNALNLADQYSLNSAAGGNLLERRTQDVLTIIENKSKCLATGGNTFPELRDNIQGYVAAAAVNYNQGNSSYRPLGMANQIRPPSFAQLNVQNNQHRDPLHPNIPYPSRMLKQKQQEKEEVQIHKFWKMFKQLHVNITLADALILIPKYKKMHKSLLSNKEKFQELANTPLNENCSAVILNKLPEKLGDPGKFLIPCGFSELKYKALADLGASINLMPLFVWKKLDVFVPVGKFTFPADFVIVDYESDPRVPLILGDLSYGPLKPQKESINMINIYDDLNEDFLENLSARNHQSGNPTFHPKLTLPKVKDYVFDPEGGNVIKSLNNNPTPDRVLKPLLPSHIPIKYSDSFLERSDTSLSLPEYEIFIDYTDETNSGSTITHADYSLPKYDSFLFEIELGHGKLTSVVMKDNLAEPRVHVPNVLTTHPTLMLDSDFVPFDNSLP